MTTETISITLPAYAADTLGESVTINVPAAWADRVRALAPWCPYGPTFDRGVVEALLSVDRCVCDGYSAVAYDHLLAAERRAGSITARHAHDESLHTDG